MPTAAASRQQSQPVEATGSHPCFLSGMHGSRLERAARSCSDMQALSAKNLQHVFCSSGSTTPQLIQNMKTHDRKRNLRSHTRPPHRSEVIFPLESCHCFFKLLPLQNASAQIFRHLAPSSLRVIPFCGSSIVNRPGGKHTKLPRKLR